MSGEATIRRGVRNARYSAIPNHVFEDDALSMEARWLLSYLLSKPDNWTVVIGDICRRGNCGRDKARKMIAELVERGYAEREQVRADGKFGASVLVIFDEPHSVMAATDAEHSEGVAFVPQPEMPSPAKPSPVSPSPVKSAHSNNLKIETTDSEKEGDASAKDGNGEDPRAVERAFRRWYGDWPTRKVDSQYAAQKAWGVLSAEQRAACIANTPTYIERLKAAKGGRFPYAGVYLAGRDWEKLDDPKADVAAPMVHGPFTRAWFTRRLAELLEPEAVTMPAPTVTQRRQMAEGGHAAALVMRERRQRYGWPRVNLMDERAADRKGMTVSPTLFRVSEGFVSVNRDSDIAAAWRRLYELRGWPWMPSANGVVWLFFPALNDSEQDLDSAVKAALERFEAEITAEGISNDAA